MTNRELDRLVAEKVKGGEMGLCDHCNKDINMRNPSGFCDHLYYPELCPTCHRNKRRLIDHISTTIFWGCGTIIALILLPIVLPFFIIGTIARKFAGK